MYENGVDSGRYYSVNVPLRDGIDDNGKTEQYLCVTLSVLTFLLVVFVKRFSY
jgi:hypothetical protein